MTIFRILRSRNRFQVAALSALVLVNACASRNKSSVAVISNQPPGVVLGKPLPSRPMSEADVEFVTGMIAHHAQAIVMARWAPSHNAGPSMLIMCEKVVVAQGDEINVMSTWLKDHGKPVPEDPIMHAAMPGMQHAMMPGMLSEEQMKQLDAARGAEFDRLFLTFMIQHHQGAIAMVDKLLGSYGGAQDDFIYKLASDIWADQMAEIQRMQKTLDASGK